MVPTNTQKHDQLSTSAHPLIDHALSKGPALFEDLSARLQRLKKINEFPRCIVTAHRRMPACRGAGAWAGVSVKRSIWGKTFNITLIKAI